MRTTVRLIVAILFVWTTTPAWTQNVPPRTEPPDLSAYRLIFDDATPAPKKIEMAEAFLADQRPEFLKSMWRDNVFVILYLNYKHEKNWPKVLDTVDRVEKLVPGTPADMRVTFYSEAMTIADKELKDVDMTIAYARRILAIDPNNVAARQVIERTPAPPK